MVKLNKKLEESINTGTAITFLNVQWFARLAEILADNNLLDDTTNELIEHAKRENREVFKKLNALIAQERNNEHETHS